MLNERPEGKDKFGYVLIGLLVAFVIILVTSAVIWNSNHPEKVQENFEKIDTQQAEEKKGAKRGPYTIQLKDKKVVDCVGGTLYTYSGINVIPTCDWDHPRQLAPDEKANRQATEFAWDGCHKIYLLDNGDADKNGKYGDMLSKNGEAGYKVLPVSELQRVWDQSCPLRFINNWALDKNYVPQCYEKPVTIEAR